MATKLGTIGILDLIINGDTLVFKKGIQEAETALSGMQGRLASSARAAATFSATVAAGGVAVFAFAKRAANTVDELGKLSQKVGVSVEALSALKYAAGLSDVSLDQLSTGLRQLAKNMADTQANTGEARVAFQAMGLQVTDATGRLKGTEEMLLEVADKFSRMEDDAGKTALAMRIFGKAGADLIPFLNAGRAGIEELRKEAERLGVVFSEQMAKDAELFNDNLTRLQSGVEGLAIKLAGPLVEGLGKATKAMLEAQNRGEGFFRTMLEGFRQLVTGDDMHKWNVEFTKAHDRLFRLENELGKVQAAAQASGNSIFDPYTQSAEKLKKQVDQARAEVERLLKIKPILAPDAPPVGASGGGGRAPSPEMQSSGGGTDLALKQWEWWAGEEERIRVEASEALAKYQAEQFEKVLAHQQTVLEAEIAYREEEQRIALEASEALKAIEEEKQRELERIERSGIQSRMDWERATNRQRVKSIFGTLEDITAGVSQHNKALFQINKIAGIANAIISTHAGITKTLETYPWPLAGVMAAVHAAAGFAQVQAIRSATFGGGGAGAAPSLAGSTPAQPVTPVGGAQRQSGQTLIIKGLNPNDIFSGRQIRRIFEQFGEEGRDGGRFDRVVFG